MFKLALISSLAVSAANAVNLDAEAERTRLFRPSNYRHQWAITAEDDIFPRQNFLKQATGEAPYEGRLRRGPPRNFRNQPGGVVGSSLGITMDRSTKSTRRGLEGLSPTSAREAAVREILSRRYGGKRPERREDHGPRFALNKLTPLVPLRPSRQFEGDLRDLRALEPNRAPLRPSTELRSLKPLDGRHQFLSTSLEDHLKDEIKSDIEETEELVEEVEDNTDLAAALE